VNPALRLDPSSPAIFQHAEEVTGDVSMTCRYYGIGRKVYCTWPRRCRDEGVDGCGSAPGERSRLPGHRTPTRSARSAIGARTTTSVRARSQCVSSARRGTRPQERQDGGGDWPCTSSADPHFLATCLATCRQSLDTLSRGDECAGIRDRGSRKMRSCQRLHDSSATPCLCRLDRGTASTQSNHRAISRSPTAILCGVSHRPPFSNLFRFGDAAARAAGVRSANS
jgi:hypothetical protein